VTAAIAAQLWLVREHAEVPVARTSASLKLAISSHEYLRAVLGSNCDHSRWRAGNCRADRGL